MGLGACVAAPSAVDTGPVRAATPTVLGALDCGPPGVQRADPELEQVVLRAFTFSTSTPYRNSRVAVLSSDGTFARVLLCVDQRPSSDADWEPYAGEYRLARVGEQWRVQSSDPLNTVRARATSEAAGMNAKGIAVDVLNVALIDSKLEGDVYQEVRATLRWRSADPGPHTIRYKLSFTAIGHDCRAAPALLRQPPVPSDVPIALVPEAPIGLDGKPDRRATPDQETVPRERTYRLHADPSSPGVQRCERLTDVSDIKLTVTSIDGIPVRGP
jgi:hypothetical protein